MARAISASAERKPKATRVRSRIRVLMASTRAGRHGRAYEGKRDKCDSGRGAALMRDLRERLHRLMQLADLHAPHWVQRILNMLPRRTAVRWLGSALHVRLAGAALLTAGLAFMGFGTLSTAVSSGVQLTTAPTTSCAADTECLHVTAPPPISGDDLGCSSIAMLVGALDPTDSYWHFVIPDSQGFQFNGSNFTATFKNGATEVVTYVQPKGAGFKGVVVEADGGAQLVTAVVAESGITGETTEAEGTGTENSASGGDFQLSSSCVTPSSSTTTSGTPGTSKSTSSSLSSSKTTSSVTTTLPTTVTVTTTNSNGSTVTRTVTAATTVVSTVTVAGEGSTQTVTNSTTVTVPTTVTVSGGTPGSSGSSSSSATPASSNSTSSSSAGVLPATTSTPSTGADIEFGVGLVLLVCGGGMVTFAARIARNKH